MLQLLQLQAGCGPEFICFDNSDDKNLDSSLAKNESSHAAQKQLQIHSAASELPLQSLLSVTVL